MAETKHQEESTLPAKRKPDLTCEDNPKKTQKLEAPLDNNIDSSVSQQKNHSLEALERDSSVAKEKDSKFEADSLSKAEDDDEEDYEDEEEDEDDDEDAENDNGKGEVDRKGRGIVRDDKGKGKLIAEEDDEDDQDDDSDIGSDIPNGESDLSDDPLAEVDLDNILPSRTRKRTVQPGVYIANDLGNKDDDSDDSDA